VRAFPDEPSEDDDDEPLFAHAPIENIITARTATSARRTSPNVSGHEARRHDS
jgi:hypothetical protein